MRKVFYIFFTSIIFISCSNNNSIPEGIMKQREMQMTYWDLMKADALAKEMVKQDSTKKIGTETIRYLNQVLAIHKISKKELDKNLNFYQQHPDLLGSIFDSLQMQQTKRTGPLTDEHYKKTNSKYGEK